MLDAFSSDAIPAHLLTREAFAGYRARLAPNGVIAMHVSNRHMELASVVAAVAAEEGFVAYFRQDNQANNFLKDYHANADVVAMARAEAELGDLPQRRGWRKIAPRPDVPAWTDDYSDVLRAILRKKLGPRTARTGSAKCRAASRHRSRDRARISPITGANLKPWPEQGEATITFGAPGRRSMMKSWSGVTV